MYTSIPILVGRRHATSNSDDTSLFGYVKRTLLADELLVIIVQSLEHKLFVEVVS